MSRKQPIVREFMSRLPVELESHEPATRAEEVLREHDVRHAPVVEGAHLYGIVSERDLLAARLRLGADFEKASLAEVCQREPLTVSPVAPVGEVAAEMHAAHVGSALVAEGSVLVGIFTTTDALRAIASAYGIECATEVRR